MALVGSALACGIVDDARNVSRGVSRHADVARFECPDCGRLIRASHMGEDGRCASCTAAR